MLIASDNVSADTVTIKFVRLPGAPETVVTGRLKAEVD